MADLLAELDYALRSKPKKDKITPSEDLLLQTCKARAVGNFMVGALASTAIVGFATRNHLSLLQRLTTTVGSSLITGAWNLNRSLSSCVNEILELEGTRIQIELAKIIVNKHFNDPSKMKLLKNILYSEEVFSDSNPEKPENKWRFRNFHFDDFGIEKSEDVEDSVSHEKQYTQQTQKITYMQRSPVRGGETVVRGGEMIVDPLECIFGLGESSKGIPHSDNNAVWKRHLRTRKRAHRRHRAYHADD